MKRVFIWGGIVALLVACNTTSPRTPTNDPEIMLAGTVDYPKIIATVELATITPTAPITPSNQATGTLDPNIASAPPASSVPPTQPPLSPTPYVGVFLGEPTSVNPGGDVSVPPTLPPLAVQPPNTSSNPNPLPNTSGAADVVIPPDGNASTNLGDCTIPIADAFQAQVAATSGLGCPTEATLTITLVVQRFERGRMFWRDTKQIIAVSNSGEFWRLADTWTEGQPLDDPSLVPPAEGLSQPVRGFGLAWRQNVRLQDALGWALAPEFSLNATWQSFEGGTLFTGDNGGVVAVPVGTNGVVFP